MITIKFKTNEKKNSILIVWIWLTLMRVNYIQQSLVDIPYIKLVLLKLIYEVLNFPDAIWIGQFSCKIVFVQIKLIIRAWR